MAEFDKICGAKGIGKVHLKGVTSASKLDEIEALCNSSDSDLDVVPKRPRLLGNVRPREEEYNENSPQETLNKEKCDVNQVPHDDQKATTIKRTVEIVARPIIFDFAQVADINDVVNHGMVFARRVSMLPKAIQSLFIYTSTSVLSALKSRVLSIYICTGVPTDEVVYAIFEMLFCLALWCYDDSVASAAKDELKAFGDGRNERRSGAARVISDSLDKEEDVARMFEITIGELFASRGGRGSVFQREDDCFSKGEAEEGTISLDVLHLFSRDKISATALGSHFGVHFDARASLATSCRALSYVVALQSEASLGTAALEMLCLAYADLVSRNDSSCLNAAQALENILSLTVGDSCIEPIETIATLLVKHNELEYSNIFFRCILAFRSRKAVYTRLVCRLLSATEPSPGAVAASSSRRWSASKLLSVTEKNFLKDEVSHAAAFAQLMRSLTRSIKTSTFLDTTFVDSVFLIVHGFFVASDFASTRRTDSSTKVYKQALRDCGECVSAYEMIAKTRGVQSNSQYKASLLHCKELYEQIESCNTFVDGKKTL